MVEKVKIEVIAPSKESDIINELFLKEWRNKLFEKAFIANLD